MKDNSKEDEIDKFIFSLKGSNIDTEAKFNEMRKLAISNGGFLNNQYRQILFKKLFGLSRNINASTYTFLNISDESNTEIVVIDQTKASSDNNELIQNKERRKPYGDVIIKDTERTVFNQIAFVDNMLITN